MRRITVLLTAAVVSSGLVMLAGFGTANAQCPGNDGTLPGSSNSVIVLGQDDGTNGQTVFVDDRDFLDIDDDGDAGGLWLYLEDNSTSGLTRGGDQVIFRVANPDVPFVAPIPVLPPDPNRPVRPEGLTLFPSGIGGGSLAEAIGSHDDCKEFGGLGQPATPDAILF